MRAHLVSCDGCGLVLPTVPDCVLGFLDSGTVRTLDMCQECMDRFVATLTPASRDGLKDGRVRVFFPRMKS